MGLNRFLWDKIVRNATISPVVGGDYDPAYPIENVRNIWTDCTYRTTGVSGQRGIVFESASAISVTGCALFGLNVTSGYQILRLERWVDPDWVLVGNFLYSSTSGWAILMVTSVSSTKYRVLVEDTSNPDGYLEFGTVLLGDYQELSRGYEFGATDAFDDVSDQAYSKDGHINVSIGYESEVEGLSYELMSADEAKLRTVWVNTLKRYPFVFIRDSANPLTTMKYVIFRSGMSWQLIDDYFKGVQIVFETVK
jgi:hypothetical protein